MTDHNQALAQIQSRLDSQHRVVEKWLDEQIQSGVIDKNDSSVHWDCYTPFSGSNTRKLVQGNTILLTVTYTVDYDVEKLSCIVGLSVYDHINQVELIEGE